MTQRLHFICGGEMTGPGGEGFGQTGTLADACD